MGVNWAAGLMRWQPFVRNGTSYPLHHLHPFRFDEIIPANEREPERIICVNVGFAMHTFTRGSIPGDPECDFYKDEREVRTFDEARYLLSKQLPNFVRTLSERSCEFSNHDNYLSIDISADGGVETRYGIFFGLRRRPGSGPKVVELIVQSAYAIDPSKRHPGRGRITFRSLLLHALRGTHPKRPR